MLLAPAQALSAVVSPTFTEMSSAKSSALRNVAPVVILSTTPAILVTIDGPPQYTLINGGKPLLLRVVNTRALLLTNAVGKYYLHLFDGFLEAGGLDGPWSVARNIPQEVRAEENKVRIGGKTDLLKGEVDQRTRKKPTLKNSVIPWVYLSQGATELIITDGIPDFISIAGTRLFYARNTTSDLFFYQGDETKYYLLKSGRWFHAEAYLGPWELAPDEEIPPDFEQIPDKSIKGSVKAWLPSPPIACFSDGTIVLSGNTWLAGLLSGRSAPLKPLGVPATFIDRQTFPGEFSILDKVHDTVPSFVELKNSQPGRSDSRSNNSKQKNAKSKPVNKQSSKNRSPAKKLTKVSAS